MWDGELGPVGTHSKKTINENGPSLAGWDWELPEAERLSLRIRKNFNFEITRMWLVRDIRLIRR
jgi:hypothetical protein